MHRGRVGGGAGGGIGGGHRGRVRGGGRGRVRGSDRGRVGREGGGGRRGHGTFVCFLVLLPQVDLGVPLAFIAPCKLSPANVAGEGLFACVGADVGSEVVAAAEVAHADATLEGLLARVDADVAGELVGAREAAVAGLHRAGIGALVRRRLARPVGVLAHAAGLDELRLVGGIECLQVLRARLGGKGLDGGEWSEGGLLGSALQALEGLLVWGAQAQVPLLLRKQVVGDHGDLEAALGGGVGRRRVLERRARRTGEGLALRLGENVSVGRGEGGRRRVDGAAVVGGHGTAQGWALGGRG